MAGGTVTVDESMKVSVSVFYDRHWQVVSVEQAGGFVLQLEGEDGISMNSPKSEVVMGKLSVSRVKGDSLVSFPVAARGKQ